MPAPTADRLTQLLTPVMAPFDVELVDIEYSGAILRITIDRDGGLDLSVISRLTRQLSNFLDENDPIAGKYTLEVSSPGLERPLRTPAHFAKAIGSTINIKVAATVEGDRRFHAVLQAVDDAGITVQPADGDSLEGRHISFADIVQCKTVFEWHGEPKPTIKQGVKPTAKTGMKSPIKPLTKSVSKPVKHESSDTSEHDKGDIE